MRDAELGRRALAGKSVVSGAGIEEGTYDAFEWDELQAAQQIFLQSRMLVDDRPGIRVDQIRDRCIVLKRSRNLKAIVIDHVRLIQALGKFPNHFARVEHVTGVLKVLAKDLGISVIRSEEPTSELQ